MKTIPQYPFEPHYFDVAPNFRMHYVDEGPSPDAPPVVMVHGNPTWSFYYRRLIESLRGSHRCIAPDHIGMGLSDKPGDAQYEYTLPQRVADLTKLIDALDLEQPVTLVVHDWGGMIGMAWAARYPDRIARLVVLNTGAFRLPAGKSLPASLRLSRTPLLGALLVRGCNLFALGAAKHCVTRAPLDADARRGLLLPYDSWENRRAVHRFVQDIPLKPGDRAWDTVVNTENRLHHLAAKPMLICWGANDFVFDDDFLGEWRRRFPNAAVHRFADCGHYILEDAHDDIIPLIHEYL